MSFLLYYFCLILLSEKICAILYCTLLVSSNLQHHVCVILYSSHLVSSYSIQQVWFTLLVPRTLSTRSASFSSLLLLSCLSLRSMSFVTLLFFPHLTLSNISGHIARLVTCLATDKCLTPNPGAVSSSSMVIFLPSMASQVHINSLNLSLNFKPRFENLKPRFKNFKPRFERKSAH